MHEGQAVRQIVAAIAAALRPYRDGTPTRVTVRIGQLRRLQLESVRWHYAVCTRGTPLEHVALDVEMVPAVVRCGNCGWQGAVADAELPFCSACRMAAVHVLSGREITVAAVELASGS